MTAKHRREIETWLWDARKSLHTIKMKMKLREMRKPKRQHPVFASAHGEDVGSSRNTMPQYVGM